MSNIDRNKKPLPVALSLGILGGAALIITTQVARGPVTFFTYSGIVIAIFVTLRALRWTEFSKRFKTSFFAFMIATIITYLFVGFYETGNILKIPIWGHFAILGGMSVIGGLLSFAVAYLADIGQLRLEEY